MTRWQKIKADMGVDTGTYQDDEEKRYRQQKAQEQYQQYQNQLRNERLGGGAIGNFENQVKANASMQARAQQQRQMADQNAVNIRGGYGAVAGINNTRNKINAQNQKVAEATDIVMGRGNPEKIQKYSNIMDELNPKTRKLYQDAADATNGFKGLKGLSALTRIQEQTGQSSDEVSKYADAMKPIYKYQQDAKKGLGEKYFKSAEDEDKYLVYAQNELDKLPNDLKNDIQGWMNTNFNKWEGFGAVGYDTEYEKEYGKEARWL